MKRFYLCASVIALILIFVIPCHAAIFKAFKAQAKSEITTSKKTISKKQTEFEQLLAKAEAGDAEAQFKVAIDFLPSINSVSEEGVKWLTLAAENGHANAQFYLKMAYREGHYGVTKNVDKYVYWLTKLAENQDVEISKNIIGGAQIELACKYSDGLCGLEKNLAKFLKWAKKSVANGCTKAANILGFYYMRDRPDKNEAIYWFKKSMDLYWDEYKKEDADIVECLRELGVTYHPGGSYASTRESKPSHQTNVDSHKATTSSSVKYNYTMSGRGRSMNTGQWTDAIGSQQCEVEFFDNYISVNGACYNYVKNSGSWKVYGGQSWNVGGMSSTDYYYVDAYKNMKKVCELISAYGFDTFVYPMSMNGDPTPNNISSSNNYNNSPYSSSSSNHSHTTQSSNRKCVYCNGTGQITKNDNASANFGIQKSKKQCPTCGEWYDPNARNHYHVRCGHCGGTGYAK